MNIQRLEKLLQSTQTLTGRLDRSDHLVIRHLPLVRLNYLIEQVGHECYPQTGDKSEAVQSVISLINLRFLSMADVYGRCPV
jgi:hypothetical protein